MSSLKLNTIFPILFMEDSGPLYGKLQSSI